MGIHTLTLLSKHRIPYPPAVKLKRKDMNTKITIMHRQIYSHLFPPKPFSLHRSTRKQQQQNHPSSHTGLHAYTHTDISPGIRGKRKKKTTNIQKKNKKRK